MSDEWVLVYSSNLEYEVEILKMRLGEEGIMAYILDKRDSAYKFGDIELYVKTEDAFLAKQFISKHFNHE